jgi:hypothetical protein
MSERWANVVQSGSDPTDDEALERLLAANDPEIHKNVHVVRKRSGKLLGVWDGENGAIVVAAMSARDDGSARVETYRRIGKHVFVKVRAMTVTVTEEDKWKGP